jgi:3-dehydroquinate dehydratase / shikimate dehydrogenase
MTLLCVPLTASTPEQMRADMRRAFAAGADIVELRLDMLAAIDAEAIVRQLLRDKDGPVIVTCRIAGEGGRYAGNETDRARLFERLGLAGADCLDCEFAAYLASRTMQDKCDFSNFTAAGKCEQRAAEMEKLGQHEVQQLKLILSSHDFDKTPADLNSICNSIVAAPGNVVKVVGKASSILDNLSMLDAVRNTLAHKPTIGLCMGEPGLISRVLARKVGAWLTFAALETGAESAPGQVTIDEMKNLYRWDILNENTAVYGVIGNPVGHSMSPAIHNAAFAHCGINAVYLPLLIEPDYDTFAAFLDGCRRRPWLHLGGCSVTIPHKVNALRYVGRNVEELARRIGAVNTILIEDGTVRGLNTDYAGAIDAVTDALGCTREDLKGSRAAILGAGGAGRAIVAALCHYGCRLTLYNRTPEKARVLADEFDCQAAAWEDRCRLDADLVINTTSLGMHPKVEVSPLPAEALRPTMAVFDMVYNPIETRLLADARSAGCTTIDGATMFVNQAVAQFEAWTHREAPVDLMRQVVLSRLR